MTIKYIDETECSRCGKPGKREITVEEAAGLADTERKSWIIVEVEGGGTVEVFDPCEPCKDVILNAVNLIAEPRKRTTKPTKLKAAK